MPKKKAKGVVASLSSSIGGRSSDVSGGDSNFHAFTPAQCQQLLSLISCTTAEKDSPESDLAGNIVSYSSFVNPRSFFSHGCYTSEWIIDTGVRDHITAYFPLLINPRPVDLPIYLPNGHRSRITHKATVNLRKDIVLNDVFFLPTFQ